MADRIFNFSAGPAVMPVPVLKEVRDNLLSLGDSGIGILEHSHRSKAYSAVHEQTEAAVREVGSVPDDYHVLFMQGGASMQFPILAMNLLGEGKIGDYINTGSWSKKAIAEAKAFGNVHVPSTSEDRNFCYIPSEHSFSDGAEFVHFTSNNTIFGTQFSQEPAVPDGSTLICDASSDIFSRPIDVSKYAMIYAGTQKNLGPAGAALVIIRDDLLQRCNSDIPAMMQYSTYAEKKSLYNTPPTFAIYVVGLVCQWILDQGGLSAMQNRNESKAGALYEFLEQSSLFNATADAGSRSRMNVTFVTGDADTDAAFIAAATAAGFDGLKGHRSVGGMRASIYNAFPPEGVDQLVSFMRDFEASK